MKALLSKIKCCVGSHKVSVALPDVIRYSVMNGINYGFTYCGEYGFCERCGQKVDVSYKGLPMLLPRD